MLPFYLRILVVDVSNRGSCSLESPKILALSILQLWQCLGALTRQEAVELYVRVWQGLLLPAVQGVGNWKG